MTRAVLVLLLALAGLASAASTFVSMECRNVANAAGGVNVTYYENGLPKCAAVALSVTAPNGAASTLTPIACSAEGVHSFSLVNATQRGIYKLRASAGGASAECVVAGLSGEKAQRVSELDLLSAAGAALLAAGIYARSANSRRKEAS